VNVGITQTHDAFCGNGKIDIAHPTKISKPKASNVNAKKKNCAAVEPIWFPGSKRALCCSCPFLLKSPFSPDT